MQTCCHLESSTWMTLHVGQQCSDTDFQELRYKHKFLLYKIKRAQL